jgi:glycosyltransferase involved in cell wall biosynthesis
MTFQDPQPSLRPGAVSQPATRPGRALVYEIEPLAALGLAAPPVRRALDALARWNAYLQSGAEGDRQELVRLARWLAEHALPVAGDASGWPLLGPSPTYGAHRPFLSAGMQGLGLAVLSRAYWLTGDEAFLKCADRVLHSFALDILDGGVGAPAGGAGLVFEQVAVYPAAHVLSGFLQGLLGLQDVRLLPATAEAAALVERGHTTLHTLLEAYDTGYGTRVDLVSRALASRSQHVLHAHLLGEVGQALGCERCIRLAARWRGYSRSGPDGLRRTLARADVRSRRAVGAVARRLVFRAPRRHGAPSVPELPAHVCVPITAYPVAGGMRSVLSGWMRAMEGVWRMEFLARSVGANPEGHRITSFAPRPRRFGLRLWMTSPQLYPNVLLYVLTGFRGLTRLLRRTPDCALVLPQDGIWTAAFATLAARLAGVRVVTVDHGNIQDLFNSAYHAEVRRGLQRQRPLRRLISRLRLAAYWPTLRLLARMSTGLSDHFLAASDDIVDDYRSHLRVPAYRLTRFPFIVDVDRYPPPGEATRADLRDRWDIPRDAIVVAMVNRLHPMKGLDVAVKAIQLTCSPLPSDLRRRLRVLIAGEGELRTQVESDIQRLGLEDVCQLLGEATPGEVVTLLGASDMFLYTGVRGINSMAVLEAMAAGCAVVGATSTRHIADYLADDRGIAVPPGDPERTSAALFALIGDETRRQAMGMRARAYIGDQHTAAAVRRCLLRVSSWSPEVTAMSTASLRAFYAEHPEGSR